VRNLSLENQLERELHDPRIARILDFAKQTAPESRAQKVSKLVWFKTLKASARNCSVTRSVRFVFL
jgi:hypothetical protein